MSEIKFISPVEKGLIRTTFPIFLAMFLGMSLTFADTWFLSHINDDAAGAVGALFPVIMLIQMLFSTLGQCGVNVGSQYLGKNNLDQMYRSFGISLLLNLFVGISFSFIIWLGHGWLASTLGLKNEVLAYGNDYLGTLSLFFWSRALIQVWVAIFNALGRGRVNVYMAVLNNILNIALNYFFISGRGGVYWSGAAGLALATGISQIISIIIYVLIFSRKYRLQILFRENSIYGKNILKNILRIGLPASIEPIAFQFSQTIYAYFYVSLGAMVMATRIYTMNIVLWVILWSSSLGLATQILIAEYIGRDDIEGAKRQMKKNIQLGLIGSAILMIILVLLGDLSFRFFTDNEEILKLGTRLIFISFFLETGRSLNLIIGGALRASGDTQYPTYISLVVIFLLAVPLAYLFTIQLAWGLTGLWLAMSLDEWIRGLINLRRWRTGIWFEKRVRN
jgi:putative MATE family efflux protein